jgi:peptidoglycan-associated lipoprotein
MPSSRAPIALASTFALVAPACAHKAEPKQEPPAPAAAAAPQPEQKPVVTDAAAVKACVADTDCQGSELCSQGRCVAISEAVAECALIRVHFAFNSSDILPEDRSLLERSARCLSAHQHLKLTIEGNADERGTEEYNLALGDRRANTVARYLKTLGAPESQLSTISFGKVQPMCTEHDERCWAQNRRAAVRPPSAAKGEL